MSYNLSRLSAMFYVPLDDRLTFMSDMQQITFNEFRNLYYMK